MLCRVSLCSPHHLHIMIGTGPQLFMEGRSDAAFSIRQLNPALIAAACPPSPQIPVRLADAACRLQA